MSSGVRYNTIGTGTNDDAPAGSVGEFISSVISSSPGVSFSNATAKDLTSINLTPGDWDVWGNFTAVFTGANSSTAAWISSSSASIPDVSLISIVTSTEAGATDQGIAISPQRFKLNTTTTIYLSGFLQFSGGTVTGSGFIYARRVR